MILSRFRLFAAGLLLMTGISYAWAQTAAQHTIFDAFRSIFQAPPSPASPADTPRPRKTRKPRIKLQNFQNPQLAPLNPGQAGAILPAQPPKPNFFVQVLGDSLAQLLAQGLAEALTDKPEIVVVKRGKESSGLVRDDYFNWQKATQDLLNGPEQTDIAVIMIGSNDHQPFLQNGKVAADLGSDEWTKLYRTRAEAEASLFRDKKIKLVWVGMPIMRAQRYSAEMSQLNEIYRDVAAQTGATYIDIWQVFTDENGQFSQNGPDINGQPARLRTSDGIYLTKPGQRKLASFVEKEIRHAYEAKKAPPEAAIPAPQPETAPAPDAKPDAKPDTAQTAAPVKVERPISGAIMSLTAPPSAANGEFVPTLASRKPLTADNLAPSGDFHPGRADDFSWTSN